MSNITPDRILQTGLGFMASKTVLSAVEFNVFGVLASDPLPYATLVARLGLHPRSARDFLDALVALQLLSRTGDVYANAPEADRFLDPAKPSYVGGLLEMANRRLYAYWGSLSEALRTGQPQNESKTGGNPFDAIYSDPAALRSFLQAMTGISLGAAIAIAQKFPWSKYKTFLDVGGAQGAAAVQVARHHPQLTGGNFDLPVVGPIFEEFVAANGLSQRLRFYPGDFFKDPLPASDVLIMGHILHDWNLDQKRLLLARAIDALPAGGALIVYDSVIDDDRRQNVFGLLMSLNMLIETPGGFDYTGADCQGWMREAGFSSSYVEHLAGPHSMVVGLK